MIRVLFVVLAVVAMVLAIVLGKTFLYLVAIVLLLSAGGMVAAGMRSRHMREKEVVGPPPVDPQDELKSLGIVGIRPKGAPTAEEDRDTDDDVVGEPVERPASAVARRETAGDAESGMKPMSIGGNGPLFSQPVPQPSQEERETETAVPRTESTGSVRTKPRTARILVEGVSDAFDGEVMLAVLRGLRAALDATTVCLLKQDEGATAYSVEAVVSRNAFARNGGRFAISEPLVAGHRPMEPVVTSCGTPGGLDPKKLGYYHEPIAIRQAAFVPLAGVEGGPPWLLVADSTDATGLDRSVSRRSLAEFARLVHSFVARGMPAPARSSPNGVALRPRREIIAEEMEEARSQRMPLALALVYLNRAEAIGESGENEVREADSLLVERLESNAESGRVERFGELTYGIFRHADLQESARWASDLQSTMALETGLLQGGVSVGIAMLDDRHDGPDELRSDATAALRESFETGECIILE